jgi:hypothetical protein
LFGFLAAVTFIHNGMAAATVELAAILTHEKTLNTLFCACTNHGYHILSKENKNMNLYSCQKKEKKSSKK